MNAKQRRYVRRHSVAEFQRANARVAELITSPGVTSRLEIMHAQETRRSIEKHLARANKKEQAA